jgi:purine-cytosine permease-like protein
MKAPTINWTKHKQTAFKLTAGVAIVASSFAGFYSAVNEYTNFSELATKIVTASIVAVFVCVLADSKTSATKKK